MLKIKLICVGKLKEKEYLDLTKEYAKRLGAFCELDILELQEEYLPSAPSEGLIITALERESEKILKVIPPLSHVISLCIEGKELDSVALSEKIASIEQRFSKLCFIIGGSNGLSDKIKKISGDRISFSRLTFPHHLFRVMLLEQIYRAYTIINGRTYHK
ncbi:MAG: 23S rRNA (pseudouridine(1915)-N(3))-methyltransferase RlmH [Clostridiales bacterium]|nr:23S rRNA (pseudouridine(1915)-N(3))-methyltransferase RlmH [Clostridiales bacterium]